jgi:hypothetical protein
MDAYSLLLRKSKLLCAELAGYPQRAFAAFFAISARFFLLNPFARAFPPMRPNATAAGFFPSDPGVGFTSSISPVAILPIMTVRAFTSAGRFSPFGPRGIRIA